MVNDREELFKGADLTGRFVAMPLEITAHPVHAPVILRANKGGLGYWRGAGNRLVTPVRTDLEDLHTLAFNLVPKVKILADVWRWPPTLEKALKVSLAALSFKLGQRHSVGYLGQNGAELDRRKCPLPC
jgi:hypothetical protein